MKIKFFVETNWPRGKKREPDLNGIDWVQTCDFPIMPRVGDMVMLNEDEDYREVEQVFLMVNNGELDVAVHFKYQDEVCWADRMAKAGWLES